MKSDRDTSELDRSAYGAARVSAQRLAIARAADAGAGRAFSVEELASEVHRLHPGIGLATVYRAVAAMEKAGFIEGLGTRDGATVYARCEHGGHHHHVMCTSCGAVTEVTCTVDTPPSPGPSGFEVTDHRLVLYGLCGPCRDRRAG